MDRGGFPKDPLWKLRAQTLEEGRDFATIKPGEEGTTEFEKKADYESALKSALGGVESRASKMIAAGADFFPKSPEAAELFAEARGIRIGMEKNLNVSGTKLPSIQKVRRNKVYEDLGRLDTIRRGIKEKLLNPQYVRQQMQEVTRGIRADNKIAEYEAEKMVRGLTFAASQRIEKELSMTVDGILLSHAGVASREDIEKLMVDGRKKPR